MGALLLFVCLLAPIVLLCAAVRGSRKRRSASPASSCGKALPLPPGSMGWPYVGETFQLYSSKNPNVFFARKQNRYGPIFKTHILGCPCVMVSSPEAARFVLVTQAHLFKPTFPASKERMLGPQAIFFQQQQQQRGRDLLASFLDDREALTDAQIADNVIGVIFAARDTTASVLTWMVKFLGDNPAVLKAVIEEQQEIARSKGSSSDEPLTWADTRRMRMTSRVIQETMRVASILSFTFREAVEDVEYQGYLIPKGWKVMPLFRNIHHSPDHFPCPEKFDPSRAFSPEAIRGSVPAIEAVALRSLDSWDGQLVNTFQEMWIGSEPHQTHGFNGTKPKPTTNKLMDGWMDGWWYMLVLPRNAENRFRDWASAACGGRHRTRRGR